MRLLYTHVSTLQAARHGQLELCYLRYLYLYSKPALLHGHQDQDVGASSDQCT